MLRLLYLLFLQGADVIAARVFAALPIILKQPRESFLYLNPLLHCVKYEIPGSSEYMMYFSKYCIIARVSTQLQIHAEQCVTEAGTILHKPQPASSSSCLTLHINVSPVKQDLPPSIKNSQHSLLLNLHHSNTHTQYAFIHSLQGPGERRPQTEHHHQA